MSKVSMVQKLSEADRSSIEGLLKRPLYAEALPSAVEARSTVHQRNIIGRAALRLAEAAQETAHAGLVTKIAACAGRLAIFDTLDSSESVYQARLRKHQHSPYKKMFDFVSDIPASEALSAETDLTKLLTRAGYLRLATGYGKTVLMSILAKEIGVGNVSPHTQKRTRALIMVPSLTIMKQIVGTPEKGGFAKFAPDISATTVTGKRQDFSGDAVVMTYKMLLNLMETNPSYFDEFQAVFFDEAHHAHGEQVSEAVKEIIKGKIAVGFSATPDPSEKKLLKEILPYEIDSIGLREAIEADILRKARLYAFASGQVVKPRVNHGDFSERSIKPLRKNKARNELIQNLAKSFIEDGRQGIVSCIRGDECEHAYELARTLNTQEIYDKTLGRKRPIVALAVKGNDRESEVALALFEEGKVDVLFYVDKLTEGWDNERVGFVINAAPTLSSTRAEQRMGRGTRPGMYEDTIYAEIMDLFEGAVRPVTMFDIMGESTITQGIEIGPKAELDANDIDTTSPEKRNADVRQKEVPYVHKDLQSNHIRLDRHPLAHMTQESITAFQSLEGVLLDELIVEGSTRRKPPEGWVPLSVCGAHLTMSRDMLIITADSFADGRQREDYRVAVMTNGRFETYVAPDVAARIEAYKDSPLAPPDYKNYPAAMLVLGLSRDRLISLIGRVQKTNSAFVVKTYKDRTSKKNLPHLSPAQIKELATQKAQEERIGTLVSLIEFSKELGFPASMIANYLNSKGYEPVLRKVDETVKPVRCYSQEAADRARQYFNKPIPSDGVSVEECARRVGMSPEEFSQFLKLRRYLSMIQTARFKDPNTGRGVEVAYVPGAYVKYLDSKLAIKAWSRPRPPEDVTPQVDLTTTTEKDVQRVRRARHDVALKPYTFDEIMETLGDCDLGHVGWGQVREVITSLRSSQPGVYRVHGGSEIYSVEFLIAVVRRLKRMNI